MNTSPMSSQQLVCRPDSSLTVTYRTICRPRIDWGNGDKRNQVGRSRSKRYPFFVAHSRTTRLAR
jgi:hypothetical protein